MKLTLIAEGATKWQRFIRRWGVSFLIGDDVLFDTFGRADIFSRNINRFNININRIQHVVLSHDDWDHIAGLWYLISDRKDITVYICPGFKQEIKDRIASFGINIIEAGETVQIKDNIYSTGELYGESDGRKIYEQSVVVKTTNGLAGICGCAHPGAVSIVRRVKENFQEGVYSLIGGFHLKDNADKTNLNVIKDLKGLGIHKIAPMHCTGKHAAEAMHEAFGQGFVRVKEGDGIEL